MTWPSTVGFFCQDSLAGVNNNCTSTTTQLHLLLQKCLSYLLAFAESLLVKSSEVSSRQEREYERERNCSSSGRKNYNDDASCLLFSSHHIKHQQHWFERHNNITTPTTTTNRPIPTSPIEQLSSVPRKHEPTQHIASRPLLFIHTQTLVKGSPTNKSNEAVHSNQRTQ
jgi:hypothetical protein